MAFLISVLLRAGSGRSLPAPRFGLSLASLVLWRNVIADSVVLVGLLRFWVGGLDGGSIGDSQKCGDDKEVSFHFIRIFQ